ncbi:hypothetical protein K1719_026512 [Acacia pycnantha]|nr:hypothetical protein K1719_026512 [Acacia pycnantha]
MSLRLKSILLKRPREGEQGDDVAKKPRKLDFSEPKLSKDVFGQPVIPQATPPTGNLQKRGNRRNYRSLKHQLRSNPSLKSSTSAVGVLISHEIDFPASWLSPHASNTELLCDYSSFSNASGGVDPSTGS